MKQNRTAGHGNDQHTCSHGKGTHVDVFCVPASIAHTPAGPGLLVTVKTLVKALEVQNKATRALLQVGTK